MVLEANAALDIQRVASNQTRGSRIDYMPDEDEQIEEDPDDDLYI